MSVAKEFKEFVLRGNVVDLAVGVVIGAAFGDVVKKFVADLITPLVGIAGKFNFADWKFSVNSSQFLVGDFVNSVLSFIIISAVIFLFVVKPVNWLMSRNKPAAAEEPVTKECPECLSSIPVKATRCAYCTAPVKAEG
ncbi:MAG: large conductance mechanosensitive channel protein MscL [Capsulimonadaceae bacterium]|nr:large conductance mechanosensitive channel protein MscL [Capsulimonadaceae bacterium]